MSNRPVNGKKIAAYIGMPLLFWLIIMLVLVGLYFLTLHDYVLPISQMFFTNTSEMLPDGLDDASNTILQSIYDGPVDSGETVDAALVKIPEYGTKYGEIVCDRIGLQCDLYFGDSDAALKMGAGQTLRSLMPGFGQPTMASGHNNREFNLLKNIEIGDIITVHTNYGTYEYEVSATEVMNAAKFDDAVLIEQKPRLILYTCYPFDMLGLTPKRFFVYAEQISGPTVVFN